MQQSDIVVTATASPTLVLYGSCYLESSNPANLRRYEGLGFTALDRIAVATGHVVTTMWSPATAPGRGTGGAAG